MPNITGGEILIILLVALIVLGPQRLPDAARSVARAAREFRRVQSSVETEIRSTIDEVTKPVTETASAMQQSINETTKEISPGGPGTRAGPGRRPTANASPAGAERAADDASDARGEGEDDAGAERAADTGGNGEVAPPGLVPPPAAAAGTAVFTPRDPLPPRHEDPEDGPAEDGPAEDSPAEDSPPEERHHGEQGPASGRWSRTVDDWGEAGLYDDAR